MKSLIAFEATVRLGSMTAAARELCTTQPAVSQQIRSLEDLVGGFLLDRTGGTLIPTAAGEALYRNVAPGLSGITSAIEEAQAKLSRGRPTLNISANFGFVHLWLLRRMQSLEYAFPDYIFNVTATDVQVTPEIQESDIDIVFGQRNSHLDTEVMLSNETVFPVCSPGFAKKHGISSELTKEHMVDLRLLHMDSCDPRWLDWNRWSILAGLGNVNVDTDFKFNNYPLLLNAAIAGQGLTLGWETLVEEFVASGQLVRLGPAVSREDFGYLLRNRHKHNTVVEPVVNWFIANTKR
ncbi:MULTISPECIES: LysR family transcriptional regulator [unclassified Pseudomonas]|uniref:LysR family transcriptional regulator n=1 Tax=unclassified Pseudomonas TaxID=196821 RepID=UPI0039B72B99